MANVGWATLSVIPSFDGFQRRLQTGTAGPLAAAGAAGGTQFGDAAGKSAGSRFSKVFATVAKAGLIGFAAGAAGAIKLAGDSVSAASDLEESTNKVGQIFGKNADDIFKFTERTADALGQSNTAARDAASTFGTFGKAAGFADQKNAKFSKRMTRLASDLASFHNTEPDEAVQALGAALRGESEPIRKYGVLLDEATLKAEAMALGILKPVKDESKIKSYQVRILEAQQKYNDAVEESGKKSLDAVKAESELGTLREGLRKATEGTLPPLTQQQKLLAAQSQIFKQTSDAQGDFSRTSDGLANQQRRLSARFEDAKAKLGKGLLPIMTDAADFLLEKGLPAFEDFSDWFTNKGIPKIKRFGNFLEDEVAPKIKTAAGFAKDLSKFLNDLPAPAKYAGLAAALGGVGAFKLRGGTGGALGTAGKALGLAKPVPVFVTNQGFGTGAGAGGATGGAGAQATKFGKLLPILGQGGLVVGLAVGAVYGTKIQSERFAADSQTPSGLNPGSRVLTGRGFGSDDPDKTARAYVNLGNQYDLSREKLALYRDGVVKFNSTVDKTPREVETLFKSKGQRQVLAEIQAVKDAISAGLTAAVELTPRGFGSDAVTSAGVIVQNQTVIANSPREIAEETRRQSRKKARAGH